MPKTINHTEYPKSLRKKSLAELDYIIKDCKETIEVNPDNINNGYYLDEITYASMEKRRRNQIKSK